MSSINIKEAETPNIRTPDQRLRVFISSTLQELAAEREVVCQAINRLRLIPVFFESGARPHPPQELYRAYLSQSHIFIAIYWQNYGWVAPGSDVSGIEDEYRLSEDIPKLIYIKTPAPKREQGLIDMLARVKDEGRASYKHFSTSEELEELVANDLVLLLSERFERSLEDRHFARQQVAGKRTNLPPELTRFIGREELVDAVSNLLEQEHIHLVTLTGPGGVGKTRLALKVAVDSLDSFTDGVWLVDLAPVSNPTLLVQSITNVLGIREEEGRPLVRSLTHYLRDKTLLLILDNCEHLIKDVAQLVEDMLCSASDLRILATSRESLGARGEIVRFLPSLSSPGLFEEVTLERLMQYEAVKLFADRAVSVRSDFSITSSNAFAVAQICARLDGIPLAIELAAARIRVLSVEEIAARLDDRFRLLVGTRTALPRQQTLRALIDWSHDLLSEDERLLLRRLSVFTGGWTLETAEEICSGEGIEALHVLDLLTHLIDKSLVIAEPHECGTRYRFLDMIRHYGRERLEESKETHDLKRKHAGYFLKIAEQSYGELWGPLQGYWLARLEADHDNLRFALEWVERETGGEEMLLRMTGSLWRFWEIRGYISEGRAWLERALVRNPNAPPYLRANGLRGAGNLARQQGDYLQAKAMHEQSLALFRDMGDEFKLGTARELNALAEIAQYQGDYLKSVELHEESLALRHEIGDKEGVATSLGHLGIIARDQGHYQQASGLLEESLILSRELEDKLMTALALRNLGLVAFYQCDYPRASELFEEALSIYRQSNDKLGISDSLQNLGNVAKDQGDYKRATTLYTECLQLKQELGDRRGIAQAIASLAELTFYQGNYLRAGELSEQSLSLFQELGVKRGIVFSLGIQAYIAHYQGDYHHAESLAKECLDLSTEINAPRPVAYSKQVLGLNAFALGNLEEAIEMFHEALDIFQNVGDRRNVARVLVNLARTAYHQGDHAKAKQFLDESLSISREIEIQWTVSFLFEIMSLLEREIGNYDRALNLLMESLEISTEQENQQGITNCLGALAGLAAITNDPTRAARLYASADRLRQSIGAKMGKDDQQEYEHYLAILGDQMNDKAFEAAWLEGNLMTTEQIIQDLQDWSGNSLIPVNTFSS